MRIAFASPYSLPYGGRTTGNDQNQTNRDQNACRRKRDRIGKYMKSDE